MFTVIKYSEEGSNEREKEEATFMFFVDYLDDCEGSMFLVCSCSVIPHPQLITFVLCMQIANHLSLMP